MKKIIYVFAILAALVCMGCRETAEEIQEKQSKHKPVLISSVNGVNLYRVHDVERCQEIYFTTPIGDVQWKVHGEDASFKQFNVSGKK